MYNTIKWNYNKVLKCQELVRRRRRQACSIAGQHLDFHSASNPGGECQNLGNAWKTAFLSLYISSFGRAGYMLEPLGVHFLITSTPKIASLARAWATVLGTVCLLPFLVIILSSASSMLIKQFTSILLDGRGSFM